MTESLTSTVMNSLQHGARQTVMGYCTVKLHCSSISTSDINWTYI